MKRFCHERLILIIIAALTIRVSGAFARPNVLLICVDDLRPVLGCYGGSAKTPNLDKLARSAVVFNRHYVQFPSCGPSRASMMGGVRPDSFGVYGNAGVHKIADNPDTQPTLPLHFRNNGYTTLSFGKTYHGKGGGPGYGWSEAPWHPPSGWTCYVNFKYEGKKQKNKWRPAYEIYDGPDHLHGDYQTASQAIKALKEHRSGPFFIAAGFYKPHLPFVAPKRFWDLYDPDDIELLEPRDKPRRAVDYPYEWSEIWSYGDESGSLYSKERPPSLGDARDMTRAYYAAVSFIDAQVGRLLWWLNKLELSQNTAVVVWSDHGFHLGDQARWAKWTQFESDMRSPFMVRFPGVHGTGRHTTALVESVDLYPTLVEYAGLPLPNHLDGRSLLPIVKGDDNAGKPAAYSQVRPISKVTGHLLAYSVRTPGYRYIEWRDTRQDYKITARELYDLRDSAAERMNVADHPDYRQALEACREHVQSGYHSLSKIPAN